MLRLTNLSFNEGTPQCHRSAHFEMRPSQLGTRANNRRHYIFAFGSFAVIGVPRRSPKGRSMGLQVGLLGRAVGKYAEGAACAKDNIPVSLKDLRGLRVRELKQRMQVAGLDVAGRVDKESLLELVEGDANALQRVLLPQKTDMTSSVASPPVDYATMAQTVNDSEIDREADLAVATYEALVAFRQRYPEVMKKEEPNYLGTPVGEEDLARRFRAFVVVVGSVDEALDLVSEEPLLLAMQKDNLKASLEAFVKVAGGDRKAALQVARRRPACLIAPASSFEGKTLAEFEAVAEMDESFKPITESLRSVGPQGLAMGAAALGFAALGAVAAKAGSGQATGDESSKKLRPKE